MTTTITMVFISFADDTYGLSSKEKEHDSPVKNVDETFSGYGMEINEKKKLW